ncbi:alternative ribosome rescue aminoacyl-tRNA hydrolase ArfB [Glaciecola sp. 1036]|uniref:alternative ribosome rescue aminoacyl-tRNA hydrolase ArfB n=1 Tax=Alteromonadaceae TaxID=72275 RepID=UPI003CFF453C
MLTITPSLTISENEIEFDAIRSMGKGGQNVNKVATAIHLRFDINQSSLPDIYKARLLELSDTRINKDGIVVIKAQSFRTQEKNKDDALQRLQALILSVTKEKKPRKATRPSLSAKKKRVDNKKHTGKIKALRGRIY